MFSRILIPIFLFFFHQIGPLSAQCCCCCDCFGAGGFGGFQPDWSFGGPFFDPCCGGGAAFFTPPFAATFPPFGFGAYGFYGRKRRDIGQIGGNVPNPRPVADWLGEYSKE